MRRRRFYRSFRHPRGRPRSHYEHPFEHVGRSIGTLLVPLLIPFAWLFDFIRKKFRRTSASSTDVAKEDDIPN